VPVLFGQTYPTLAGAVPDDAPGGLWTPDGPAGGDPSGDGNEGNGNPGSPWTTVGPVDLALTLRVGGTGVLPEFPDLPAIRRAWRAVIALDDEDVSGFVTGEIEIRAAEGAARVASFRLLFPPGRPLALAAWSGLPVAIDFAEIEAGQAVRLSRLFTGVIDSVAFEAASGILSILATDDLQTLCDRLANDDVDALTEGALASPVIFDPARSAGWQRVQDRMSTLAASLDLDVWRAPRLTFWAATPERTLAAVEGDEGGDRNHGSCDL
jgi:hypothetical protein